MNICRFQNRDRISIGCIAGDHVIDLAAAGLKDLTTILEQPDPAGFLRDRITDSLPRHPLASVRLLAPVERQEVWAAGVTYLRSKTARMEESDFSATAYDRVYAAERPEIFFKSVPEKVSATGEPVGIRKDAKWSVPEPELALVLNSRGAVAGFTIGNDMSSRDIEGENLLYLPQAKIYRHSCALGPWITIGVPETAARQWVIRIRIVRNGSSVFAGETSVDRIKRSFGQLAEFLFRSQDFPHGAVLLTGTGVVPDDTFTLQERDEVRIEIDGIGVLENPVVVV